jgi:hypothetical protein
MSERVDTTALRAHADEDVMLGFPEAAKIKRDAADEIDALRDELDQVRADRYSEGWRAAVTWFRIDPEQGEGAYGASQIENRRLRAVIADAPHEEDCCGWHFEWPKDGLKVGTGLIHDGTCDCWKSRVEGTTR